MSELCPDRHSEVEQVLHIATIREQVRRVRGMDLDQCLGREPQALPLDQFVELYPAPDVLDPHAGTGHVMVPRELLVEARDWLVLTAACADLVNRIDGAMA